LPVSKISTFSRNFAEFGTAGDKGSNTAYFGRFQAAILYVYIISLEIHDCHSGFNGRNIENIELSLSELLPVYLADRLHQTVVVAGDKYCIFGRVQEAIEN